MALLLIEAGWRIVPALSARLARIKPFADPVDEARALRQAYLFAPKASFSRAVLEASPPVLAVFQLPATVSWSDWGTPDRVLRSLRGAKLVPPWVGDSEHRGTAIV